MKMVTKHAARALLLLASALCTLVAGSLIGFDAAFTNPAIPYVITECDAACTSVASVTFQLRLARSGDLTGTDTVHVFTRPSSDPMKAGATSGTDYTPLNQVAVVFSPSEASKLVTVTIVSDGVYEEDEFFEAVIENPSDGVTVPSSTQVAYLKIQDGGDAGIFSFSTSTYTFSEGAGLVQVKVVRNGGASGTVTVTYRLANPTQATAISTKSFLLTDSIYRLTFEENQREAFIPIRIIQDAVYESREFFYLELSALAPSKANDPTTSVAKYGASRTAVVFIADDGDAGQFDFVTPSIFCREDNGSAVVSIVRSLGSSTSSYTPVTLQVATVGVIDGSNATEGGSLAFDYLAASEKLKWANGETQKTFSIKVFNNKKYNQQTRAFKVRMSTVEGGASIGPSSEMWVYIVDDRDAGTLSFKQPKYEVAEDDGSVTVEIVRGGLTDSSGINTYNSGAITVDVATFGGTIRPGLDKYAIDSDNDVVKQRKCTHVSPCTSIADVDYTALASTTVTFADGETTKTITISIVNDDLYEAPDQVFKIILQNVTGGAHIGIDYEHPPEWFGYGTELLALDKRRKELLDNVGTIVTITDDGDPAVLISKASLSVSEIGQTDAFDVWLNSIPSSDVTVTITFDATALEVSPSTLTFTTINWSSRQTVRLGGVANDRTGGLPSSLLEVSTSSTDATYNSPLRSTLAGSGVVIASKIYTQLPGTYFTGNMQHAFPWPETAGVLTGPASSDQLTVFVFDDDPSGVRILPERVRHQSNVASGTPANHVAIRFGGHNATLAIELMSEPAGDVVVTFEVDLDAGVQIMQPTLTFTAADWNTPQLVDIAAIAATDNSTETTVSHSTVRVYTSSAVDSFYAQPEAMARIYVTRYPPAKVMVDASVLETRENDKASPVASYSVRLGSEPMHWEPPSSLGYKPSEIIVRPSADTSLTVSEDVALAATAAGTSNSISVASNSSSSSASSRLRRLGILRFSLYPSVYAQTGSIQVGSAKLRIFRMSGGENGGLGGITVGVAVADGALIESWDEASLRAVCTSDADVNIGCLLRQTSSSTHPLSSLFPGGEAFGNLSRFSMGETVVSPTGSFNGASNSFIPSTGWLEIDVTVAVNDFLTKQHQLAASQLPTAKDLTFVVYTKAPSFFVYDGVTEVSFASKDHRDTSLHPRLIIRGSGKINVATATETVVSQSHTGSARAAVDGRLTSRLGVSSTFAMALVVYRYPWWQANLGVVRLIDDIVVTIKKRVSTATFSASQLPVSVWLMLSDVSLATNNRGLTGFTAAVANARYAKQFTITTRSFSAGENDNVVLRWRVFGAQDGAHFDEERFVANYSSTVEAQFLLLQVEGENNIALNEVQIFQPPLASARVSVGGYMPSPSVVRKGKNQIRFDLGQVGDDDPAECDADTLVCRRELVFTSGDWWQEKSVQVQVVDDDVATGDRDVLLSHTVISADESFNAQTDGLFSDSDVKPLRILDDDEVAVLFSTSELEVEEGGGVYPNAPIMRHEQAVVPPSVRCSDDSSRVQTVSGSTTKCALVFKDRAPSSWEVCIQNLAATTLEVGSAWMMAGFVESDINVTSVALTIPRMQGAKYVKKLSLWWTDVHSINSSSLPDMLNVSNSWAKVDTFEVTMLSSGEQKIEARDLALASIKILLVTFDESYDEDNGCLIAPRVEVRAMIPVTFPLRVRGDLVHSDSVPPAMSGRSRMHQFGKTASLGVRLASEPIRDVVVKVVAEPTNTPVAVYDAVNASSIEMVVELVGGQYPSGEIVKFEAATAIRFTPENWNQVQELAFLAVDDNVYNSNRTFPISHEAESLDAAASEIPVQSHASGQVNRTFTGLPSALAYNNAPFIVTNSAAATWPRHFVPAWTSPTGTVHVTVTDDDLPGITLSQSTVIVSESSIEPANYSVCLDSAPKSQVVVSITYPQDASLFTASPTQLTFTTTNWKVPQFVSIDPVANEIYDAGEPLTISYHRLIAKKSQPLLLHSVTSAGDPDYNTISIGTNEHDSTLGYVVDQGVVVVVQDDDTGCPKEYECLNGGTCVNVTYGGAMGRSSASVCRCPETYGMKNCAATCSSARDCAFSQVEFRLQCRAGDGKAVCGDVFYPARLVSTLYRMLTTDEFTTASGRSFSKLSLGAMEDVLYIVNSTTVACVGAGSSSAICVNVVVDVTKQTGITTNPIVEKLQGYLEAGSLQSQPIFAELMASSQQFPESIGATVAVWVFLGFCLASVGGVATLFSLRALKVKKFHVRPDLDGEPADESDTMLQDHRHAR